MKLPIPKTNVIFSKFLLLSAMLLMLVQTITAQNAKITPFALGGGVPGIPQGLTGPTSVGQGSTTNYSITTLSTVPTYTWKVNPSNAATSVIWGYGYCSVTWSSSYSGSAQVSVSGVNSVGTGSPANLTVQVGGYPAIIPGSISPASQTINYNTIPAQLNTSTPSGGNSTFTYNWQISTDGGTTYTNTGAPSLTTYTPPALTATTMYKVIYSSGSSPSVSSNAVVINVNQPTLAKVIDTNFNHAVNVIFGKLNTANIPTGILRDYGLELTNTENYNGTTLVDSNLVDQTVFKSIYRTMASARLSGSSYSTLPSPNIVDSLWYIARQPGQVVVSGLYYQYSYLNTTVNPNPNINLANGQLTDKYVNGVWQNPYLQAQTIAFSPACNTYSNLSFNIVFPANLLFTNNGTAVSNIQIDAGDGQGYRNMMPGTTLAVTYTGAGLKTWNYKVTLSNGTILQAHSPITVNGSTSTLTCYTPGCGVYVPPGGGGGGVQSSFVKTAATTASTPPDVISGTAPEYYFKTGETFNGVAAIGKVTLQYAPGHTTLVNPLIVVEGFDPGYYTSPESFTGSFTLKDFIGSLNYNSNSSSNNSPTPIYNLITSQFDIVFIDFRNGTDDIRRNALLVKSVIRWVNTYKTTSNKIQVLALSMGGLCTRYAIVKMEKAGETHNISQVIYHGTPQQGAVVPVSLQYMENHLNSLYSRSGASLYYDVYSSFDRSVPNIKGVLSLSNTPAALQMLVTHINYNNQVDTAVHHAWQAELTALGYPSQNGIKNIAISNGSECGQTQQLTKGGQILYYDGKYATSFWGDLIVMAASFYPVFITGSPAFFLSGVPGRNDILIHFEADATDGNGNRVYAGKISYRKTVLWLLPITINVTDQTNNSPTDILPYETYAGDVSPFPSLKSFGSSGWFGHYNINVYVAPGFGFIPEPSVLDVGRGAVRLTEADYMQGYSPNSLPVSPKNIPFNNFITAYSTATNNNEPHISYENLNGKFLAATLTTNMGYTPPADCLLFCQSTAISGSSYVCSGTSTFTVPNNPAYSYTWTVPSNLQIVSGQYTPTLQVQPITSGNGTQGNLSVAIYSPDCGTITLNQTIYVGAPQPLINIRVDRTPQASNYQYLNATATQLPNTVPSNYQWYQEVNGSTTNLVFMGSGLNINNYPIPPGTVIYFRCVTVTPCGQSVARLYAYNSTSATSAFIVYPNPANSTASIALSPNSPTLAAATNLLNAEQQTTTFVPKIPFSYVVYNKIGQALQKGDSADGSTVQFNTSTLPAGQYFVHIAFGSNKIEKQIFISH